jgi:hypothetical protein
MRTILVWWFRNLQHHSIVILGKLAKLGRPEPRISKISKFPPQPSLGAREQFQQVAVGAVKIHAAPAFARV